MRLRLPLAAVLMSFAMPAEAELTHQGEGGFASRNEATVDAGEDAIWVILTKPQLYWNGEHSWTGNANNFGLEPRAGGCFCEAIPHQREGEGRDGSVEHMRVVMARPGQLLRMSGALGPLQSEALNGTLSVTLTPLEDGSGTKIVWDYVVAGFARYPLEKIAPAVDAVQRQQLDRLVARIENPEAF